MLAQESKGRSAMLKQRGVSLLWTEFRKLQGERTGFSAKDYYSLLGKVICMHM